MKKLFITSLLAVAVIGFMAGTGCKKSSSKAAGFKCTTCTTTPDAVAAYDNSSKGIYKGTVVGSSGTIKFNIGNNDSTIAAVMVIDGTTVNLTGTVSWTSGSAYVSPFTGTMNGSAVSITFSVNADGSSPTIIASNIPGHPGAVLDVTKETSTNLIMVFEGSYASSSSTGDKGTFNLYLSKTLKAWEINSRSTVDTSKRSKIDGTYDPTTNILLYQDSGGQIKGTLNNDEIDGNYNGGGDSGSWTCKRTL